MRTNQKPTFSKLVNIGVCLDERQRKSFVRIISVLVSSIFLFENILWANDASVSDMPSFRLSTKIAEVKTAYTSGERTIINIQDAHASLEAQESIISILDTLSSNYDLKMVSLEGSSGYIDTSVMRTMPDEKLRVKTAGNIMKQGRMSAGEFFAITSKNDIAVYGAEDKTLYDQNLEQFRNIFALQPIVMPEIEKLEKLCALLREKVYSEDLKLLSGNSISRNGDKVSFTKSWKVIYDIAVKNGISLDPYPNLTLLGNSMSIESRLNFKKATLERTALIQKLSAVLPKKELEALVRKSFAFKQGEISEPVYLDHLMEEARKKNIDTLTMTDLNLYREYIHTYHRIDLELIFSEMSDFEKKTSEKIFRNNDERELFALIEFMSLSRNIFEIKLFGKDAERASALARSYTLDKIDSFITSVTKKYGIASSQKIFPERIIANIPKALEFYSVAEKRDRSMIANTLDKMKKDGRNVAALITGGYHTTGISDILKAKNTSYVIIAPKFDSTKPERPYVAILTNKKNAYAGLLKKGTHYIAAPGYFDPSETPEIRLARYKADILYAAKDIIDRADSAKEAREKLSNFISRWMRLYEAAYGKLLEKQAQGIAPKEYTPIPPEKLRAFLIKEVLLELLPESDTDTTPATERVARMDQEFISAVMKEIVPTDGRSVDMSTLRSRLHQMLSSKKNSAAKDRDTGHRDLSTDRA